MSTLSKIGIILLTTIIFILLMPFLIIIGFAVLVSAYCMIVKEFMSDSYKNKNEEHENEE